MLACTSSPPADLDAATDVAPEAVVAPDAVVDAPFDASRDAPAEAAADVAGELAAETGRDAVSERAPSDGGLHIDTIEDRVFSVHCAIPSCHEGDSPTGRMNLQTGRAMASLINVPAAGVGCAGSGLRRVVPGDPAASLLYLKIGPGAPPCGTHMPQGADPIDPELVELVRSWILAGAP